MLRSLPWRALAVAVLATTVSAAVARPAAATEGRLEADAMVVESDPNRNYGHDTQLRADRSPMSHTYLRFDLSGVTEPVRSATLRLYATNGTSNGPELWTTNPSWDEDTLTWNNRPDPLTKLADAGTVDHNAWHTYDVTDHVTAAGTYSFVLVPDSRDGTVLNAREASTNHPQLLVDTGDPPPPPPPGDVYDFGLIGDTGYSSSGLDRFEDLIARMNGARLAFSVHDGDIKSGKDPCPDSVYQRTLDLFSRFNHPLIYTPGDNEWRDCDDKLGRLDYLREVFFSTGDSQGRPSMPLIRQADYPENARWHRGPVTFATIHQVGPDNNDGQSSEFRPRNSANLAWLRAAFDTAAARGSAGVVLITHANPGFDSSSRAERDGFRDFMTELEAQVVAWRKPVITVHGDTHTFRVDQPLRSGGSKLSNFTRVETYGPSDTHWVRVRVDPRDPDLFDISAQS